LQTENRESRVGQWAVLAGLRFLLATIVLASHARHMGAALVVFGPLRLMGYQVAMIGFFLISGFSIAHSVRHPEGFYRRRLDRIYPVYLVGLLLALVPFMVWGPVVTTHAEKIGAPGSLWDLLGNAFFLQGITVRRIETNGPLWSLAVEALYYLFAPLFAKLRVRHLLALVGLSALAYVGRSRLGAGDWAYNMNGLSAFLLLWSWLLGFLAYKHGREIWMRLLLVAAAPLLLLYAPPTPILAIPIYLLVAAALLWPPKLGLLRAGGQKTLQYLGELSYPLYVVHWPILVLLCSGGQHHPAFMVVAGCFLAAVLVYHGIDAPMRRRLAARQARQRDVQSSLAI
jgi:peptidoglycan/LPS O-acetylase OafA/YrhL